MKQGSIEHIEFKRKAGSLGGRATSRKYGKAHYQKTGNLIVEKYGKEHFKQMAVEREAAKREAKSIVDNSI